MCQVSDLGMFGVEYLGLGVRDLWGFALGLSRLIMVFGKRCHQESRTGYFIQMEGEGGGPL